MPLQFKIYTFFHWNQGKTHKNASRFALMPVVTHFVLYVDRNVARRSKSFCRETEWRSITCSTRYRNTKLKIKFSGVDLDCDTGCI